MRRTGLIAALAASLVLPTVASAQGGPGFLFTRPRVSFGIRTGYVLPRAKSELFDFTREQFTLNRWDFGSPYLGGELAIRASERWDVALTAGWARSRSASEYRNWVDSDDLPIEQETTFQTVSGAVGGKYYLVDRGRSIGQFAWVPSRLAPFVGAGIGVVHYDFEQAGDFVDFQTLDVFFDQLKTSGSAAFAQVNAGADLSIGKQFFLTGEARYSLASAGVAGRFDGFDNIDLSGLQVILGIAFRL